MDNIKDDVKIENEEDANEPESKIKKLKEQLKKCKKEKEDYLHGWQRAKADFVNARKDEEKRRAEFVRLSNQFLLTDILPVFDSFELALRNSNDKGVYMIKNQMKDILKGYGLEEIKAEGKKFSPEFHESVEEVESKEKSGEVVEEIQKGYTLHGKVLRPARVKISK